MQVTIWDVKCLMLSAKQWLIQYSQSRMENHRFVALMITFCIFICMTMNLRVICCTCVMGISVVKARLWSWLFLHFTLVSCVPKLTQPSQAFQPAFQTFKHSRSTTLTFSVHWHLFYVCCCPHSPYTPTATCRPGITRSDLTRLGSRLWISHVLLASSFSLFVFLSFSNWNRFQCASFSFMSLSDIRLYFMTYTHIKRTST